jgi:hypothetical protein
VTEKRPHTEDELIEFVRSIDVRAPESLHASVQSLIDSRTRRRSSGTERTSALGRLLGSAPRLAAAAGAVAVVVLVLVLSLGGGAGAGPSVRQTAALTTLPATAGAPSKSHAGGAQLAATVDGVAFPYWEDALGWRATGTRTDHVGGRTITTVFYANHAGWQVGYSIVGGLPAPTAAGGTTVMRGGTRYQLLQANGAPVVTWLRAGHLCVVTGRGVGGTTLLHLASWHASVV